MIKEKIINCEFAPGAVYNEEYLCEEVNTSRTPVRDALGRLEQEGLIKIMPKRGILLLCVLYFAVPACCIFQSIQHSIFICKIACDFF